jgi:hypothetical protein
MKKKFLLIYIVFCSTLVFAQHSAILSWTNLGSYTGNNVYRGTVSGGPYTKIATLTSPATTYTDNSVVALTTYYYVVSSTCTTCSPSESGFSNEVKAIIPGDAQPQSPSGLTVTTK